MLTDKLTYARLSGLNAHAHGCRHPLISAVAATLLLLAALSILDILGQPNLDGLVNINTCIFATVQGEPK